jgi:hypothetical protein
VIKARVELTANHLGRWSLRLCPLSDPSQRTERKELSQRCFNRHVLRRADRNGLFTYVPGGATVMTARYKLPKGVRCDRCVLQWMYETANSCAPRGIPKQYAGINLQTCGTRSAPFQELFINCADIKVG